MAFWNQPKDAPAATPEPAKDTKKEANAGNGNAKNAQKDPPKAAAAPPPPAPTPPAASAAPAASLSSEVLAAVQTLRSSLSKDTSVTGKLSFNSPTRIDGKLKGEVRANDLLVIGEEAHVDGAVRAQKLIVLGEVDGEITVAEHAEIAAGAKVRGRIEAAVLVVREGAFLDGECKITGVKKSLPPENA